MSAMRLDKNVASRLGLSPICNVSIPRSQSEKPNGSVIAKEKIYLPTA